MKCQRTYGWAEVCNCEWLLEKFWTEAINDFWNFLNQQDKIRNVLLLTYEVPG
jgi:hypothetical protein